MLGTCLESNYISSEQVFNLLRLVLGTCLESNFNFSEQAFDKLRCRVQSDPLAQGALPFAPQHPPPAPVLVFPPAEPAQVKAVQARNDQIANLNNVLAGLNSYASQIEGTDAVYVGPGEGFGTSSALYMFGNGDAATARMTLDFTANAPGWSGEVGDVAFRINDFDWGSGNHRDIVTVRAFDADGNAVAVTLTYGTNTPITGFAPTLNAANIATNPAALNGSVLVQISGPITRIEVDYSNGLSGTQAIWIGDISFTALPAETGDDTLSGGGGDDLIYGEAGNDLL